MSKEELRQALLDLGYIEEGSELTKGNLKVKLYEASATFHAYAVTTDKWHLIKASFYSDLTIESYELNGLNIVKKAIKGLNMAAENSTYNKPFTIELDR